MWCGTPSSSISASISSTISTVSVRPPEP
jgi:hypothetical protein